MRAGREMDALVAEKVMGKVKPTIVPSDFSTNDDVFLGMFWGVSMTAGTRAYNWYYRGPQYSTSISAAWEVVEKLKADGLMWCIYDTPGGVKCGINRAPMECLASVEADTAPLAICLAALKAVGASLPEADTTAESD